MSDRSDRLLMPWIGPTYRHVNAQREGDILDFTYAGLFGKNRWNVPGEPTLYLAGDIGVAIAEWGRRFPVVFPGDAMKPNLRVVFRLHLRLDSVLDARRTETLTDVGFDDDPGMFRDIERARLFAGQVRTTSRAQAMIVPSIAFLDDLTRWNLVVFLDRLPADTASWITRIERIGPLSWDSGTP